MERIQQEVFEQMAENSKGDLRTSRLMTTLGKDALRCLMKGKGEIVCLIDERGPRQKSAFSRRIVEVVSSQRKGRTTNACMPRRRKQRKLLEGKPDCL